MFFRTFHLESLLLLIVDIPRSSPSKSSLLTSWYQSCHSSCGVLVGVAGSPFLVKIGGEPTGRMTERITRQREAADITHVGSQCELSLKIPGA